MAKNTDMDKDIARIEQLIGSEMGLGGELTKQQEERQARLSSEQSRIEKFKTAVLRKESKAHRVAIDFGGGVVAQASTELMNWGIRAIGRWSKDGFWANNVDLLQGAPHFVLGLGLYFAEMLTRNDPKGGGEWVTPTREVISEASKIFGQLGFSNLMRAMRVRWGDGKKREVAYQAIAQEKAQLESKLAALQAGGGGGAKS
ncbi:MAG: hypothetical protein JNJ46_27810 [Myxococcales bacterium]|nr:hypothetical protein [Myxococcales bacterium]